MGHTWCEIICILWYWSCRTQWTAYSGEFHGHLFPHGLDLYVVLSIQRMTKHEALPVKGCGKRGLSP